MEEVAGLASAAGLELVAGHHPIGPAENHMLHFVKTQSTSL